MKRVFGLVLAFCLALPLIIATNSTYYLDQGQRIPYECSQLTDFATLVGGATPDSAAGFGAVDICGYCYTCGVADGICPEDFYSNGQQGSCSGYADPDCTGCILGSAQINFSDVGLQAAQDAQVHVRYYEPHLQSLSGPVSASNGGVLSSTGDFSNVPIISGVLASVWVQYTDPFATGPLATYISEQVNITSGTVTRGAACYDVDTLNGGTFTLNPAPCQADCTRGSGLSCDPSCNGINGCQYASGYGFSSSQVAAASDGYYPDDYVELQSTFDENSCTSTVYYTNACTGAVNVSQSFQLSGGNCGVSSPSLVDAQSPILNLVTRVYRVWYDGPTGDQPVELVIMHWDEETD